MTLRWEKAAHGRNAWFVDVPSGRYLIIWNRTMGYRAYWNGKATSFFDRNVKAVMTMVERAVRAKEMSGASSERKMTQ